MVERPDRNFDLRSLPHPSTEQFAAFGEHISAAHSWYKHLPLLTGREFVVFLAPDSGIGRLVVQMTGGGYELVAPAEGSVFTEEHPRLHYSWKTSEEYRRRFGYLDYASRGHDDTFGRDVGGPMELPREIWDRCTFTLFPYVSPGRWDSIGWAHEDAVEQLRVGASHPRRETVLEWARLDRERDLAWQGLTGAEREVALARGRGDAEKSPPTSAVDHYFALEADLEQVYWQLQSGELAKIQRALDALRAWLDGR
jgi:hypothetical protein